MNNHGVVHALFLEDAEFSLPVTVLEAVKAELAACSACKITYADPINFTANTVATTLSDRLLELCGATPRSTPSSSASTPLRA